MQQGDIRAFIQFAGLHSAFSSDPLWGFIKPLNRCCICIFKDKDSYDSRCSKERSARKEL